MHNLTERDEALHYLNTLIAAYRCAQFNAADKWAEIREAYEVKVARCRRDIRQLIFLIRENDFEGVW